MKLEGNLNGEWELRGYSDTDYTEDNDNLEKRDRIHLSDERNCHCMVFENSENSYIIYNRR